MLPHETAGFGHCHKFGAGFFWILDDFILQSNLLTFTQGGKFTIGSKEYGWYLVVVAMVAMLMAVVAVFMAMLVAMAVLVVAVPLLLLVASLVFPSAAASPFPFAAALANKFLHLHLLDALAVGLLLRGLLNGLSGFGAEGGGDPVR